MKRALLTVAGTAVLLAGALAIPATGSLRDADSRDQFQRAGKCIARCVEDARTRARAAEPCEAFDEGGTGFEKSETSGLVCATLEHMMAVRVSCVSGAEKHELLNLVVRVERPGGILPGRIVVTVRTPGGHQNDTLREAIRKLANDNGCGYREASE